MTSLTESQKRALLWLPRDGSWTTEYPPGRLQTSLNSLWGYPRHLVEGIAINHDGSGGRRYHLTPAGLAMRKEIEGEKL